MSSVKIIHSCSDFVVAVKKAGVHSAPLYADDTFSALSLVAQDFPQILKVRGRKEIEGGLVHRIDCDTAGLLLLACNQGFYQHIMECQEAGLFTKKYLACCNFIPHCPQNLGGFPPSPIFSENISPSANFTVSSAFRPYGPGRKQVRPVTEDSGKFSRKKASRKKNTSERKLHSLERRGEKKTMGASVYSTNFFIEKMEDNKIFVQAAISKGYRHQVRCHLAWCSLPIVGDSLYNPSNILTEKAGDNFCEIPPGQMQFFATGFSFPALDYPVEKNCLSNGEDTCSSAHSFSISPKEILNI